MAAGALLAGLAVLVVFRPDAYPLQLWDESRVANNAMEMVHSGDWLVTAYGGLPDHWNTKPPLLIWMIAALWHLGLPPLVALRLPSMLAAAGAVMLAWGVCRYGLRDRVAGVVAGSILLGALQFTGHHVARSGDYDAALTFFETAYVLAFWAAAGEDRKIRGGWFVLCGAGVVLAVLTKGVAGGLALPGLLAFSMLDGRWRRLLRDGRAWAVCLAVVAAVAGYYVSRELHDPGYLQSVRQNELGGRFLTAQAHSSQGPLFYLKLLALKFEPGLVLLGFAILPLRGKDWRRRSLVLLCVLTGAILLVVVTGCSTKYDWYVTPVIPLFAVAAAVGVSDGMRWIAAKQDSLPFPLRSGALGAVLVLLLGVGFLFSFYRNQIRGPRVIRQPEYAQCWYGSLLDRLPAGAGAARFPIVDSGVPNVDGFENYNPLLRFYAGLAERRGVSIAMVDAGAGLADGARFGTCDPASLARLGQRYRLTLWRANPWCVFGQVAGARGEGGRGDVNAAAR